MNDINNENQDEWKSKGEMIALSRSNWAQGVGEQLDSETDTWLKALQSYKYTKDVSWQLVTPQSSDV